MYIVSIWVKGNLNFHGTQGENTLKDQVNTMVQHHQVISNYIDSHVELCVISLLRKNFKLNKFSVPRNDFAQIHSAAYKCLKYQESSISPLLNRMWNKYSWI